MATKTSKTKAPASKAPVAPRVYTADDTIGKNRTALTAMARAITGNKALTKEDVCGKQPNCHRGIGRDYVLALIAGTKPSKARKASSKARKAA